MFLKKITESTIMDNVSMFVSHRELLQINVIFLTGLFILVSVTTTPEMNFLKLTSFKISMVFLCISSFLLLAVGQWAIKSEPEFRMSSETRNNFLKRIHNACIFFTAIAFAFIPLVIFFP